MLTVLGARGNHRGRQVAPVLAEVLSGIAGAEGEVVGLAAGPGVGVSLMPGSVGAGVAEGAALSVLAGVEVAEIAAVGDGVAPAAGSSATVGLAVGDMPGVGDTPGAGDTLGVDDTLELGDTFAMGEGPGLGAVLGVGNAPAAGGGTGKVTTPGGGAQVGTPPDTMIIASRVCSGLHARCVKR